MKSKLLRFLLISTGCALILGPLSAVAEETPRGLKLGLDTAKAIAEQKDVAEGLKAVAKDELSNWMWNSIGGYEKIVFQNTEADIPGVREKAKKIYEAIESVDKAATAVAEGKYDDALISSVDTIVGVADHPLVSATWAAVKLTYESHKLVKSSQAELEIETLYGMVNNDRRLLGTAEPKSDTPPQIPVNSDTSDYFFDKYVMANDNARQMMKSYVEKVLGDTWPEQSWSDYAKSWMAIGSGVDTARSAEVEALATEWRQKGRTWTTQLLKDVNKQARVAWGETRVRQQLAEFKVFYERAKMFYNGDIDQMLKEFTAIKQYQKELPSYQLALEDSKKQRAGIEDAVSKFSGKQISAVPGWSGSAEDWQLKLLSYSSRAEIIRENGLASSLSQERTAWMALIDRIKALVKQEEPRIVETVKEEVGPAAGDSNWRWAGPVNGKSEQYYALFADTLKPFDFSSVAVKIAVPGQKEPRSFNGSPELIKAAEMDALNAGDLATAQALIQEWPKAVSAAMEEHFKPYQDQLKKNSPPAELVAQDALVRKMNEDITAACAPIWKQVDAVWGQFYALGDVPYDDPRALAVWRQVDALQNQVWALMAPLTAPSNQLYYMQVAWPNVATKITESYERLSYPPAVIVAETLQAMNDAYGAFDRLRQASARQAAAYQALMDAAEKDLPFTAIESSDKTKELLPINDNCAIVADVKNSLRTQKANLHTFVPKVTGTDHLTPLAGIVSQMAASIREGIYPPQSVDAYITGVANASAAWEAAAQRWQAVPALSENDILQIRVLVDPSFDPAKRIARLTMVANGVAGLVSELKDEVQEIAKIAGTDGENRAKDADWLDQKAREIKAFFDDQTGKGYLEIGPNDYQAALSKYRYQDMVIVDEPFRHFMTVAELEARAKTIRTAWAGLPGYQFIRQYAPAQARALEVILTFPGIKAAGDDNFIIPGGSEPIYKKAVADAARLIKTIKPDDKDYDQKMGQLALLLPETLAVPTARELENIKQQAAAAGMTEDAYAQKVRGGNSLLALYQLRENVAGRETYFAHPLGQAYLALRKDIATLTNARQDHLIEERDRPAKERAAAESQKAMEALKQQQQAQARDDQRKANPADFYGWQVMDVRLNSYSTEGATGDILIGQDKLVNGQVRITARMNHIDGIKTMLISEDGGMTWKSLPVDAAIDHTLTPFPDRLYDPILQFITQEGLRANLRLFSSATGFRYRAVDRTEDVIAAVQALADAYEHQDAAAFAQMVARDYLGNKTMLEEGVRFDFDMFLDIQLKIYINRIQQSAGRYTVETRWDKAQTPRKTGQVQKTTGTTTITFAVEDGSLKVQNLRGDLIYATLSPDIAQASGLATAKVDAIRTAQAGRDPVQPGAGVTEDAGGVTTPTSSSSSSVLAVHTSPVLDVSAWPSPGFDFTANAAVSNASPSSDLDLETNQIFFATQLQKVVGSTFDGLRTAPAFSDTSPLHNDGVGTVYAFVTAEGYYGKLEVTSFDGTHLQFKFAVQTDGTMNIATQ